MNGLIITPLIIFLAVAGGLQFYTNPIFGVFFVFFGILAVPVSWFFLWRGYRPPLFLPAACLLIPVALSTLANMDIINFSLSRLLLFIVALAAIVLGYATGESHLSRGLHYAGMVWPVIWAIDALAGWPHRLDTLGFWPVLFILCFWRRRFWPFVVPHLAILVHRGSRGAIVAVIVGVLVYEWLDRGRPKLNKKQVAFCLAGAVTGLLGLVMWRYSSAAQRPVFWYDAWLVFLGNPICGVGPYGLNVRQLIEQPHGHQIHGHQIHAHNIFVSWLAEYGLIGLVCLALVIRHVYTNRAGYQIKRWQLSLMAGILIWSMVDEPLFWPGPLVAAALIFGAVPKKY